LECSPPEEPLSQLGICLCRLIKKPFAPEKKYAKSEEVIIYHLRARRTPAYGRQEFWTHY
jgi:hypothetical protein